jgi:3-oxoacyl-[acyl-carrier-protein] synthase II
MVLLEPAGRPGTHGRRELAELPALAFGVAASPGGSREVLAGCVRRALAAAGEDPERVWAAVLTDATEEAAVTDVLGDRVPVRLCVSDLVGDTGGAASAFGVATLLALSAVEPATHDRTALVTAVDRDGAVGCAVLRLRGVER